MVKAHLADDFGAAFDLMLFQMGRAVFTPGYHDHALDIAVRETPDRPPLRVNDDAFGDCSPGEAMLADRSSLPFDWLEIEDRQDSFAALRALPESDKQRLFAACVARTVNGQLAFEADARPELEATVACLDIEFAAHVRPTAEMFWSRVRKDRMLGVAREVLGVEWAHAHRKDKKATLAAAMETAFAKVRFPAARRHQGGPRGRARLGAARLSAPSTPATVDDGDADPPPPSRGRVRRRRSETATNPAPDTAGSAAEQPRNRRLLTRPTQPRLPRRNPPVAPATTPPPDAATIQAATIPHRPSPPGAPQRSRASSRRA